MSNILEVQNLRKEYPQLTAVNDISFAIPQGVCFGLLGPNGAGKTTTIEIIEDIIKPTSGTILYKGKQRDQDFAQQCGIQFQHTALPDYLTVQEVLQLFKEFYHQPVTIESLIVECDLQEFKDQIANKLSGGQKQRLLLALALLNNPDIIFLDEPTTGLDPQARRNFWRLIEKIKSQGKTIVLTTHYMDEAELLCDQLIIMDHGKIIAEGSPTTLLNEHFPFRYIEFDKENFSPSDITENIEYQDNKVIIKSQQVEQSLNELLSSGQKLNDLRVITPTLEDLFIHLTGKNLRN